MRYHRRPLAVFLLLAFPCLLNALEQPSPISLWGSSGNEETVRGFALSADGKVADAQHAFEAALQRDPQRCRGPRRLGFQHS